MENDKIIKVAIYTRVSTIQQVEDGFSLETQKERLIKLAESNNYKIYKIYEEQGKSGKNTNRPKFQEMMEDMQNKKFSKILVMKLDRISRSVSDLENIIKKLQENNCGFESASEKIDTTSAMGLMFIRLLGIFAQFERERISERIKDVFSEKIRHGGAITGNLPIGYKIGLNSNNEKIVIKDLEKEQFVNDMFNKYEETSSLIKTVQYLNDTYPKFVYKGGFNTIDLKRILQNPIYYGCLRDNETYCEPYLTYEKWKRINDLRENKNIKSEKKYIYLFSGIIKGACGHRLSGSSFKSRDKKTVYLGYRCSKYAHSGQCENLFIKEEVIENRIIEILPSVITEEISKLKKEYVDNGDSTKNINAIKNLEAEKKRIINSYNKGWMSEYEADEEIEIINEKINKINIKTPKVDIKKLKELRNMKWLDIYNELSRENKQLLYRSFIDIIEVDVKKYRKGYTDFIKIELIK